MEQGVPIMWNETAEQMVDRKKRREILKSIAADLAPLLHPEHLIHDSPHSLKNSFPDREPPHPARSKWWFKD